MQPEITLCPLGFTDQRFPAGAHICQIYSDEQERISSLLGFLESGLRNGEKTACFSDRLSESELETLLVERDLPMQQLLRSTALTRASTTEVYFENGRFEPERMLSLLRGFHDNSLRQGFTAARVIGEMVPEVYQINGGRRLMEYESLVSLQMRTHPVTAVCQYNANSFDGATIMQVLKVHPLMVIRGAVVHNPYYIPPEDFLRQYCGR